MSRKAGKIMSKWEYRLKGTDGRVVQIPVRYLEASQGYRTKFCVDIDTPFRLDVTMENVDELKKVVFKQLDDYFSIDWKEYLHVFVEYHEAARSSTWHEDTCRTFKIAYRPVQLGTRGVNGDKVHRWSECQSYLEKDWPRTGYIARTDHTINDEPSSETISLVPDTKENRAKLDSIHAAVKALARRVQDLMSPNKILETLSRADNLLAAPAEPSKGKKKFRSTGAMKHAPIGLNDLGEAR